MKNLFLLCLTIMVTCVAAAQDKQQQDAEAIKKMCGCFEVTFNFAETFSYSDDSLYHPSHTETS
ncbi:MAG: DUF6607 family protein, partial [Salibacteraceae bacterium]